MKKLILHAGHSKTGSSTLQRYLHENREILLRHGILYPKNINDGTGSHLLSFPLLKLYPGWCQRKVTFEESSELFLKEAKLHKATTTIISSEAFSAITNTENIQKLKNLFRNYQVTVVFYLRRIDKWLEATYAQIIKDFPFITQEPEAFLTHAVIDIFSVIKSYAEVFSPENIVVREYDRDKLLGNDICKDFISLVNSNLFDKLKPVAREVNITPSSDLLEIMRELNRQLDLGGAERRQLYNWLCEEWFKKFPKSPSKNILFNNHTRQEFLDRFAEEYAYFRNEIQGEGESLRFDMNVTEGEETSTTHHYDSKAIAAAFALGYKKGKIR